MRERRMVPPKARQEHYQLIISSKTTIMKKNLILLFFLLFTGMIKSQNISINNDGAAPDNSAILDMKSTNKGLLFPRMTATERNNISSPASGLLVFVTGENNLYYYSGSAWLKVDLNGADNLGSHVATLNLNMNNLQILNSGNVGIGTGVANNPLTIKADDSSGSIRSSRRPKPTCA